MMNSGSPRLALSFGLGFLTGTQLCAMAPKQRLAQFHGETQFVARELFRRQAVRRGEVAATAPTLTKHKRRPSVRLIENKLVQEKTENARSRLLRDPKSRSARRTADKLPGLIEFALHWMMMAIMIDLVI